MWWGFFFEVSINPTTLPMAESKPQIFVNQEESNVDPPIGLALKVSEHGSSHHEILEEGVLGPLVKCKKKFWALKGDLIQVPYILHVGDDVEMVDAVGLVVKSLVGRARGWKFGLANIMD